MKRDKQRKEDRLKVIISGGGTGGHIFPALSIANALREEEPNCEILFIGAEDRMEMQRVPQAGYKIIGLPIRGFYRKQIWKNISVLWMILRSLITVKKIIKQFQPDVVVGVGGFASGPTLKAAEKLHIPTLLQEQNSYAGVTNKLLAKKANKICVAYPNMDKFFDINKIILTGNPVRQDILQEKYTKDVAKKAFNLDPNRPVALILGGSLGALSINTALMEIIDQLIDSNTQYIWQTGKLYIERVNECAKGKDISNLVITDFISDMSMAYAAADIIVSRAGASSISEFTLLGKPVILIPSPNVAEDHQTKNAMALVNKEAAQIIKDADIKARIYSEIEQILANEDLMKSLSENIKTLALPNSASRIAKEIIALSK